MDFSGYTICIIFSIPCCDSVKESGIVCINRDGKTIIPNGKSEIKAGDTVIVVSGVQGFHDLRDILEEGA